MSDLEEHAFVILVARASNPYNGAGETHDRLNESLDFTLHRFVRTFGGVPDDMCTRVIMTKQQSNDPLPPHGSVVRDMHAVMIKARTQSKSVHIAINGYDGMTTNMLSLSNVFRPFSDVSACLQVPQCNDC